MKKDSAASKRSRFLYLLANLVLGMVCGLAIFPLIDYVLSLELPLPEHMGLLLAVWLAFCLLLLMQVVLHEGGHLLFGLCTGYGFVSFRIGNLLSRWDGQRLHLGRYSLPGTGGQCLMSPPPWREGRFPYVLYNLGGPLMNLLATLLGFLCYRLLDPASLAGRLWLLFALFGLGMGLMNGIPMRLGNVDNDGYNALCLGKSPAALRSFWLQMKINQQISRGVRLKDMPEDWFALPAEADMYNSMAAVMAVLHENRLMDEHRFAEAAVCLDMLSARSNALPGLYRQLLLLDRLYCEALGAQDPLILAQSESRELAAFMKRMKGNPAILRTQYALALLWKKDQAQAAALRQKAEKCLASYPYPGEVQSERELLELAEARSLNQ